MRLWLKSTSLQQYKKMGEECNGRHQDKILHLQKTVVLRGLENYVDRNCYHNHFHSHTKRLMLL